MSTDKGFLIELTNNLYRLTLLFPKKEPLRYKTRELADDILAGQAVAKNLEILQSFLEVAKSQNWVSAEDLLNIQAEYSKLEGGLKIQAAESAAVSAQDSRQGKILDVLKNKGKVQVWQIKQVFPSVSKRTLRRDFESMLKQGLIERIGERNNTFYQTKVA